MNPIPRQLRVVSLLPSATEILCLVGGEALLVGRSHECDYPPTISRVPILTGQRTHAETPGEIDRAVRENLGAGSSLYSLDEAALARLQPDVILTQDLCEVCSIDLRTVERVAAGLPSRPRVVSLNPHTFEGVLDDVLTVGEATGLAANAQRAVVSLRERFYRAADHVNPFADGPSVGFLEWTDPLFVAGHWTAQLIERAGGAHPLNPCVARPGAGAAAGAQMSERVAGRSIRVTPEALVASNPEYVVICPCGFTLDKTREAAESLAREAWYRDLPAVGYGRVALVDGNQMFNRPGPRLVDAYEWLVGWLHGRWELIPRGFPWELRD